ncbi:MAG: sodium:proton antiporter [Verrucomicrobia bacterium]|nr:sodium:proton antiporter [Verrucomicrobiota bacterium]
MSVFDIIAAVLTLAAVFSYANYRWIRLPTAIGVMLIALVSSLALAVVGRWIPGLAEPAKGILSRIDFNQALMEGMLSFLLFAGALHINLDDLLRNRYTILSLATAGVALSTALIGFGLRFLSQAAGMPLDLKACFLFGALISPTDPIAVMGILRSAGAPKDLEIKIAGESLFNDGVGIVAFLILSEAALEGGAFSIGRAGVLFLQEALGGAAMGLALGWIAYRMLKSVDNYQVEVLVTLALVAGGYALADALHCSGPIATVVAGLLIGNHGRRFAMSARTRAHLDMFWELTDEALNAVLFVLIGLEALVLDFSARLLLVGAAAIPLALGARWASVSLPALLLRRRRPFAPGAVTMMTWGGLRGGISIALALSLPAGSLRDALVSITYMVVVFSILVQGLTIARVAARVIPTPGSSQEI